MQKKCVNVIITIEKEGRKKYYIDPTKDEDSIHVANKIASKLEDKENEEEELNELKSLVRLSLKRYLDSDKIAAQSKVQALIMDKLMNGENIDSMTMMMMLSNNDIDPMVLMLMGNLKRKNPNERIESYLESIGESIKSLKPKRSHYRRHHRSPSYQ
jgi:hypothetical protein